MQVADHATAAAPERMTYSRYLHLDEILRWQRPLSDTHDELLFVIIHQASELWLKLALHELAAARDRIAADDVRSALKMLSRVIAIQGQLIQSWDVLKTLTPSEYMSFRAVLGTSSGFQSWQYRMVEFVLGNRSTAHMERHVDDPQVYARLRAEMQTPSLYDETLRLLHRRSLPIPRTHLQRDLSQPYRACAEVEAAWEQVYRNTERYWDLYELAEKLVDLEGGMQQWRFGHLRTVERIIGFKKGTGGTLGVPYLAKALDQRFFPELISVRTVL